MGNKESHQMKKKLERNYITVAGKIPSTQILASHTIFQQKEPGLLGEIQLLQWGRKYIR